VLTHDLDGTATTANDAGFGFAYNPASQVTLRAQTNSAYEFPFAAGVKGYVANGRNQYTQVGGATHAWDANGNLTSDGQTTFGYDTENRLVSASRAKAGTLKYDPLGRLWEASTASGVRRFAYDGDRLVAEYSSGGALQRRYVHGAGVDEPLVWYVDATVSASKRRYLDADHQGSVVAVSNASGVKQQVNYYDPYGRHRHRQHRALPVHRPGGDPRDRAVLLQGPVLQPHPRPVHADRPDRVRGRHQSLCVRGQ
jgi:YD repeat-containing protein